jgi:hypothetical protein
LNINSYIIEDVSNFVQKQSKASSYLGNTLSNYIFDDTIGRIIKFYHFLQMRGASFDRKLSLKPPINSAIIVLRIYLIVLYQGHVYLTLFFSQSPQASCRKKLFVTHRLGSMIQKERYHNGPRGDRFRAVNDPADEKLIMNKMEQ